MGDLGKLLADYFVDVGRTASGPIEMPAEQTKQPHRERERGGDMRGETCVGGRQEDLVQRSLLGQLMGSADRLRDVASSGFKCK